MPKPPSPTTPRISNSASWAPSGKALPLRRPLGPGTVPSSVAGGSGGAVTMAGAGLRDGAQREHDALFHRLEATHVEAGVGVLQQRAEVGGALAHQVLHVLLRCTRRTRERKMD